MKEIKPWAMGPSDELDISFRDHDIAERFARQDRPAREKTTFQPHTSSG